jgi:WW domain-binding protein 4
LSAPAVPAAVSLKREAETPIDEEDTRVFKLRKKTLSVGLGQIYDPGVIPIKIKKKEEDDTPSLAPVQSTSLDGPQATDVPKWTKLSWKRPGDILEPETIPKVEQEEVKPRIDPETVEVAAPETADASPSSAAVKLEETGDTGVAVPSGPGPSLFKKRKAPANHGRARRPA